MGRISQEMGAKAQRREGREVLVWGRSECNDAARDLKAKKRGGKLKTWRAFL
jgi:hypothetical protein